MEDIKEDTLQAREWESGWEGTCSLSMWNSKIIEPASFHQKTKSYSLQNYVEQSLSIF